MAGRKDDTSLLQQLENPKTRRQAFSKLVQQSSEQLYWVIRRIVMDHDDANDVLQNTFLKAWNNLDDFKNKSKISTGVYRIAINESLDFLRSRNSRMSFLGEDHNNVANQLLADEYFDGDETQAVLQEAISKLPEVQRIVFNLRYFDEMKYSEMSKLLNTSEGALKASYHLAVLKITEYFKKKD